MRGISFIVKRFAWKKRKEMPGQGVYDWRFATTRRRNFEPTRNRGAGSGLGAARRVPGRAEEVVRRHAARAGARRQGSQLPEAGARLELSRSVRGSRRDPARARHDVPDGARLPVPLLPGPDDLS